MNNLLECSYSKSGREFHCFMIEYHVFVLFDLRALRFGPFNFGNHTMDYPMVRKIAFNHTFK